MDARQGEYQQTDPASTASYSTPASQAQHAAAGTPQSDYGINPSSARSSTFPDYIQASRPGLHSPAGGNPSSMAQSTNPSIAAASSPTYPQSHHYAPYPTHDMPPQHYAPPGMYRPEYGAPYAPPGMQGYGHVPTAVSSQASMVSPTTARHPGGGHPLSTVYSFVPIPGNHQHKRPRRRYEEIERMYKCGWNGCEKAYGTLNHLNAHVTMQSHGPKRTPEEFKEIRKEWKQRKKDEENQRKVEEDRQRQAQQQGQVDGQNATDQPPPNAGYGQGVQRQLPPLGYAPASGGQYGQSVDSLQQYPSGQMGQYYQPPQSPYGQQGGQIR